MRRFSSCVPRVKRAEHVNFSKVSKKKEMNSKKKFFLAEKETPRDSRGAQHE